MNFDLPVCRAAIQSIRGVFHLQWTGQCEKVMRDRVMTVPPISAQTPMFAYRVAKYRDRYDLTIHHEL